MGMVPLLIGISAGVLAGMFGIGGGIVIVPGLILLAGLSAQKATGTSLAALLLPVGALGAWQYWQRGAVDVRMALLLSLGIFLGGWLGARLGLSLPPRAMQRAFAVFLVLVAGQLWWKA